MLWRGLKTDSASVKGLANKACPPTAGVQLLCMRSAQHEKHRGFGDCTETSSLLGITLLLTDF